MRMLALLALVLGLAGPAGAAELDLTLSTGAGKPVSDAVVMVRPDAGHGSARLAGPFVMAQKDTQFQPYVLIVPVGAEVSFPNLDPFHHHVYSFSKAKTFELKLYGQDQTRKVTFDKPGVVALGCNIHDNMAAYIRVVDTPFAARTAAGAAVVRDLPPGPATVTIWHPFLKAPDNEITRRVTLPASGALRLSVSGDLKPSRLQRGAY
ncbi:MAG: methylamine utilization protein [Caulobacterales bacterium]|nr:methylamine utilization protein [Caulobacterales bacterium]